MSSHHISGNPGAHRVAYRFHTPEGPRTHSASVANLTEAQFLAGLLRHSPMVTLVAIVEPDLFHRAHSIRKPLAADLNRQ